MGRKWPAAIFGLMLLLVGCVSSAQDPVAIRDGAEFTFDRYSGLYWLLGRELFMPGFPPDTLVSMRGAFGRDGHYPFLQLYAYHVSGTGPFWFHYAYDSDARPLVLYYLSRERDKKLVNESVAVDLPRDYLLAHRDSGIDIRLEGRGGAVVAQLTAAYVQGFLERFDAELAKVASK